MPLGVDLRNFFNLAASLRTVMRTRVTPESAAESVRRNLGERESNFLTTARIGIFANPASPYRPLLAQAGCEFGDLQQMVRTRGLERALRTLRDAGVYFTFEEFKGREPVVRGGQRLTVSPGQFLNPALRHHFWAETGGSTGQATRLRSNVSRAQQGAVYMALRNRAYDIERVPKATWRGLMPTELNFWLTSVIINDLPVRWFTPQKPFDFKAARRYPFATYAILALSRLYGARFPWPELVPLERADVIARWAGATSRQHGGCYISGPASMCLRVCVAAVANGIDLTGVMFSGAGEPMTSAKAAGIAAAGATCRPGYYATELGAIGIGCGAPVEPNEQHLLEDKVALVQVTREVPGFQQTVDAFHFTSLLPNSTNIVLNLELDDFGIVESRSCGCHFESLGLTRHIRQIRSFRKLTGEGVCLIGSDMERILEDVLPRTFGGSPLDYQLSEDEDDQGFTRLTIVVSPRVTLPSEAAVIDTIYAALGSRNASADYARTTWMKAGTLRVQRAEPRWTARGKFPALVRASRSAAAIDAPSDDASALETVAR